MAFRTQREKNEAKEFVGSFVTCLRLVIRLTFPLRDFLYSLLPLSPVNKNVKHIIKL